jgi:HEAT repeat protein
MGKTARHPNLAIADIADAAEAKERSRGFKAAKAFVKATVKRKFVWQALEIGSDLDRRKALTLLYFLGSRMDRELVYQALISDKSAVVRHEAAFYAAAMGGAKAIPNLVAAMIGDANALVRHEAAEALGDMKARDALTDLRDVAANDPDAMVIATARIAIDQIAGEQASAGLATPIRSSR